MTQRQETLPLTLVDRRGPAATAMSDAGAPATNATYADTEAASGTTRAVRSQPENTLKDRRARALPLTKNNAFDEQDISAIPDHLNFFLPPKTATVKVEVDAPEPETEQSTVRLIGFVSSDAEDELATLALLRVGGKLVPIQAGEEFEGISLLSTNMKNRSVEIRHLDECMTLAMMDQPIENPAVQGLTPQPVRRRTTSPSAISRHSAAPDEFHLSDPGFATPPDPDLGLGSIPAGMDLELPEELRLPEMPELPELEGFPDLP
ncbi:hypothetical protein [Stieleria neptunia]|nr:hypothetical protein [Stieleria neptunia]